MPDAGRGGGLPAHAAGLHPHHAADWNDALAAQVHLSPSRLRELFKQQVGTTIGEYARWQSIWRMTFLWKDGVKFTDLAIEAGFHDLAHADRVFLESFGISPSSLIDSRYFRLVQCN